MGPPSGIPYPSVSMAYGQCVFPTPGYVPWGSVMGYNFDPMTGQPLRPMALYSYPFMSQSLDMLLTASFHPSLTDLPSLLDADDDDEEDETTLLVMGVPTHLSHVVIGGAVPTMCPPYLHLGWKLCFPLLPG